MTPAQVKRKLEKYAELYNNLKTLMLDDGLHSPDLSKIPGSNAIDTNIKLNKAMVKKERIKNEMEETLSLVYLLDGPYFDVIYNRYIRMMTREEVAYELKKSKPYVDKKLFKAIGLISKKTNEGESNEEDIS